MAKFHERIAAIGFRKKGWSIKHIATSLNVSKSTVSRWCLNVHLSPKQLHRLYLHDKAAAHQGRLTAAKNKIDERKARMAYFMKKGENLVGKLNQSGLFFTGLALYWAEGSKKHRDVSLVNSDPAIIKIWIRWLGLFAATPISELTCKVGINEIHKNRLQTVELYWSKSTGIPLAQFRKASLKKIHNHKIYSNYASHYGSLTIRVKRGTNLNYQILGMIRAISLQS